MPNKKDCNSHNAAICCRRGSKYENFFFNTESITVGDISTFRNWFYMAFSICEL